jgi:hypothetical protein
MRFVQKLGGEAEAHTEEEKGGGNAPWHDLMAMVIFLEDAGNGF